MRKLKPSLVTEVKKFKQQSSYRCKKCGTLVIAGSNANKYTTPCPKCSTKKDEQENLKILGVTKMEKVKAWLSANKVKLIVGAVVLVAVFVLGAIFGGGIRGCLDKALIKEAVKVEDKAK